MNVYRTLSAKAESPAEARYEVKKSKFIATAAHVTTEAAARAFIGAVKKRYYDARHNPSSYALLASGGKEKTNDDGEPGGTAGAPILEAMKARSITDACVVVTRYFGGIKLGAGGLIRAYGHAAGLALEAAGIVIMRPYTALYVTVPYDLGAPLEHYLRTEGIRQGAPVYDAAVTYELLLEPAEIESRRAAITDRTAGRATYREGESRYIAVPLKDSKEANDNEK